MCIFIDQDVQFMIDLSATSPNLPVIDDDDWNRFAKNQLMCLYNNNAVHCH